MIVRALQLAALTALITGCQSASSPAPAVNAAIIQAGRSEQVSVATLRQGRSLFLTRCISCHALPAVAAHTAGEWPRLIDEMAGRARLDGKKREAVLAYILAAQESR
ncbi:MAG: hypothetical protein H0W66_13870 [Chthoniobacterales bacterium]|nr:hypothetical protein [Chthoniobacterales bacterium]